jgi:predicted ATPase/class 3 adenylate cyclase
VPSFSAKQAVCASCGFANPLEFRFCGGCGASLDRQAGRPASERVAPERPQPERRQLTVLFCDLVGSSTLASRLDPEELRDLIRSYQAACTSVIRRFDGTVSRYMGDGILALFGYPFAHEDDGERAVRSGLDIVSAMAALLGPHRAEGAERLAVRVGIATGLVVAGDLIGEGASEEEAIVGETPNLAARLQGVTSPNSVVIAASTRSLIGERFECVDLGTHTLRGFADPVRAWQVLAPRPATSRFEAAQPTRVAPLVDREDELNWLLRLWQEAQDRHGRAVLLAGEAGIGKSRLVEALREQIAGKPHAAVFCQCSPHYANTALHPLIEHIERAVGIGREDTPSAKFAKLSTWLGTGPENGETVALLGALLSIPTDTRLPSSAMSPQRQKERTFELLLRYMQGKAAAPPSPIVFEDVHWVDPTTKEFLTLFIERVREMRALVVLTFRPDVFSPPWADQPHVESRELKRLAPEHASRLAEQVAGERLPKTIIGQVVAKTDGVPLFIEELTRAVLGTGLPSEQHDQHALREPPVPLAIPSTLQDSLMARLDQLGPAKLIAQVAGAIGREFSYELLEAVAPLPAERLRQGLAVLERAGLVYADSRAAAASYVFKHALVQEVAYQSLLRSRRRELHLRIAETLETRFPQTARHAPELVAHHWTEAGNAERAVAGWLAAGQRASERSEYREAIAHLSRGLELIRSLSDADEQRSRELTLLLALGPPLIMAEGAGTPLVARVYARALELCAAIPESALHFAAHWGWWRASMDHRMGRERADKLLDLARALGDPALLLQAHHCQWATLYMLGAHNECCRHVEAGLELYDPNRHRSHAALYGGHDARVCALGELALARWLLGHPQEALEHVRSALAWAEELAHVGSRAHAMDYALVLHKFRRDAAAVTARARDLIAYAEEQKLRDHRAKGAFFLGWARALQEDPLGGLGEMLDGIASEEDAGTPEDFPLYYEMLAEIYARAGRNAEGLSAIANAFAYADRLGLLFWNAELHRRRGELLLASGAPVADAAACFRDALASARTQGARSLELRAAVSLARLHRREGEAAVAATILRPVYEPFAHLDTLDAMEARELLETLA